MVESLNPAWGVLLLVFAQRHPPLNLCRWSFTNLFGGARSRAAGSISPGGTTHSASQRENSPRITKTQQGSTRRRRHSIGGDIFARFKRSAKSSKTKIPHDHAIGLCFDDTDDPNQSYHDHGPLKGTLEFADRPCVLSDLLTTSKSLSSLKTVSVAGGSEKRTSGTSTGSKAYTSSTPNRKSSGNRTQDAGAVYEPFNLPVAVVYTNGSDERVVFILACV